MGAKDSVTKDYLSDNRRFADLCNYYLFDGEQVLRPEDLKEQDTTELLTIFGNNSKQKWRDLLKQAVIRRTDVCSYIIIGIENQSEVHYAMPVRNMIYDSMNYGEQISKAAKRHRKQRDLHTPTEFLSGFSRNEKLRPVVTITLYWGTGVWDGPRSIHDMLEPMDDSLKKYVADYRLNLIIPGEITDFSKFRSSLGPVLKLFQLADDEAGLGKELTENPAYRTMEKDSLNVLNTFLRLNMEPKEEKEETDMCKAWDDHKQRGVQEGLSQGLREGLSEGLRQGDLSRLIKLTLRRFQKGDTAEAVAEWSGENLNLIQKIYTCISQQTPNYDIEAICSKLLRSEL